MHIIIGIAAALLFAAIFPRLAGIILMVATLAIGALVLTTCSAQQKSQATLAQMTFAVRYDEAGCSVRYPLHFTFRNGSPASIENFTAELIARVPGYSDVVHRQPIRSDKIIASRESYASCWGITRADDTRWRGLQAKDLDWSYRNVLVKY